MALGTVRCLNVGINMHTLDPIPNSQQRHQRFKTLFQEVNQSGKLSYFHIVLGLFLSGQLDGDVHLLLLLSGLLAYN